MNDKDLIQHVDKWNMKQLQKDVIKSVFIYLMVN